MLKVVEKRLSTTRAKASRTWQSYRTLKKKVNKRRDINDLEKKSILASERDKRQTRISDYYKTYREFKNEKTHKSPYSGFKYSDTIRTENTVQPIFKAKKNFNTDDLDKLIPGILDNKRVSGVLIVFSVESEETGQVSYVSQFITRGRLDRIKDGKIYDEIVRRFQAGNTKDYKLKFIYIRIIYEKAKDSKVKRKTRKNKK